MTVILNHESVRALVRNLRRRTGKDVKHTEILDDIADALGWRTDALMHALKTEARRDDGRTARSPAHVIPEPDAVPGIGRKALPDPEAAPEDPIKRVMLFDVPFDDAPSLRPHAWLERAGIDVGPWSDLDETDRILAKDAFARQLGRVAEDVDRAPAHVRSLVAVLALHLSGSEGRRESGRTARASDLMLEDLDATLATKASSSERNEAMLRISDPVLRDPEIMSEARKILGRHAYWTTGLMGLLASSRAAFGVLASAQFSWLKAVDRPLWYALNNVGRRSFVIEASGSIAHFHAELAEGGPVARPLVDKAVEGLREHLADAGRRFVIGGVRGDSSSDVSGRHDDRRT